MVGTEVQCVLTVTMISGQKHAKMQIGQDNFLCVCVCVLAYHPGHVPALHFETTVTLTRKKADSL